MTRQSSDTSPSRGGWSKRRVSAYGTQAALAPRPASTWSATLPVSSARWSNLALKVPTPAGRRPQLDDQVLDLGLRHIAPAPRPSRTSPGRASKPRICPRLCRDDRVDLGRRLGRHGDLDRHHRLEQHRRALRHALAHGDAARLAERHVGAVDRVIGAVDQADRDIDHGKAERSVAEIVAHADLDARDVILGHHAAGDLVGELEARRRAAAA